MIKIFFIIWFIVMLFLVGERITKFIDVSIDVITTAASRAAEHTATSVLFKVVSSLGLNWLVTGDLWFWPTYMAEMPNEASDLGSD